MPDEYEGRHTVRALSQEVWSARTGGRIPNAARRHRAIFASISGAGQCRPPAPNDGYDA